MANLLPRERALRALNFEEVDRVPIVGSCVRNLELLAESIIYDMFDR